MSEGNSWRGCVRACVCVSERTHKALSSLAAAPKSPETETDTSFVAFPYYNYICYMHGAVSLYRVVERLHSRVRHIRVRICFLIE